MSPIRSADLVAEFRADTRNFDRGASQVEAVVRQIAGADPAVEVAMDVGQVDMAKSAISGLPTTSSLGIEVDAGKLDGVQSAISGLPSKHSVSIDVDDSALDATESKISGIAGAVGGLGTAAGVAGAVGAFSSLQDATAGLEASTGSLAGATLDYDSILQGIPAHFGAFSETAPVVDAARAAFSQFGVTSDAALQGAAEGALTVAKVLGTDVNESIGAAQALVKNGLAPDVTAAFDLIMAGGSNMSGMMREEMISALNEYSANFAALGFSGEQAMAMLVGATGQGQIGVDKAGDAIKEFQVRAMGGFGEAAESAGALGVDLNVLAGEVLKGGPAAQTAFGTMADAVLGIKDPVAQAEAAVGIFGTQMEDLGGVSGLTSLRDSMTTDLGDIEGRVGKAGEVIGSTFSAEMASGMAAFSGALGEIGALIAPVLGPLIDMFTALPGPVQAVLAGLVILAPIIIGLIAILPAVAAGFALVSAATLPITAPILLIVGAIAAVIAIGVLLWQNWDTIAAVAGRVFGWIGDFVGGVINFLKDNFLLLLGPIGLIIQHWDTLKAAAGAVWDWVQSKIAAVVGWIIGKWEDFKAGIQLLIDKFFQLRDRVADAIGGVWDLISGIPGRVKDIFSGAGQWLIDAGRNIIQGLIDGVMSMIGRIGDAIGGAVSKIRNFLPFSPAKEGPLSGSGAPIFAGRAISSMLAEGIDAGLPAVESAAARLAGVAAITSSANFTSSMASATVAPSPMAAQAGSATTSNDGGVHLHFYGPVVGGEAGMRELARKVTGVQSGRSYQAGG